MINKILRKMSAHVAANLGLYAVVGLVAFFLVLPHLPTIAILGTISALALNPLSVRHSEELAAKKKRNRN